MHTSCVKAYLYISNSDSFRLINCAESFMPFSLTDSTEVFGVQYSISKSSIADDGDRHKLFCYRIFFHFWSSFTALFLFQIYKFKYLNGFSIRLAICFRIRSMMFAVYLVYVVKGGEECRHIIPFKLVIT